MSHTYNVIIIGAGFAGLGAAMEAGDESVLVLESGAKAGGRAQTVRTKRGDVINLGPNWDHLRRKSPLARLIKKFGLKWRMDDAQHSSFYKGKVYGPELKIRFLETLEKNFLEAQKKNPDTDGPFEDYLGGDPTLNNLAAYWRKIWCSGRRRNNVSTREFLNNGGGAGGIVLEDGMEALIDKLVEEVGPGKIKYNARIKSIDDSGPHVTIKTADGKTYRAKQVIVTASVDAMKKGRITFTQGLSKATRAILSQLTMGQMAKVVFFLKSLPPGLEDGRRIDMIDKRHPLVFHIGIAGKRVLSAIFGGQEANAIEKNWRRAAKIVRRKALRLNRIPELNGIGHLITGRPIVTRWGQERDIGGAYSCWKVGSTPRGPFRDGRIFFAGEAFDKNSGHISGAFTSGRRAMRMALKSLREARRPEKLRRETYEVRPAV